MASYDSHKMGNLVPPSHQSKAAFSSSSSSGKVNTAGNSGPGSMRALSPTGQRAGDNNSRGHRV